MGRPSKDWNKIYLEVKTEVEGGLPILAALKKLRISGAGFYTHLNETQKREIIYLRHVFSGSDTKIHKYALDTNMGNLCWDNDTIAALNDFE